MWEAPEYLGNLLAEQYGSVLAEEICEGFLCRRPVTLRVNTLKCSVPEAEGALEAAGIDFSHSCICPEALIINGAREDSIRSLSLYSEGKIYLQSLSSMLPPLLLNPSPNDSVLDMAAAPGGKTTQMAAMTGGAAAITACEKNKVRAERLRYNLQRQGCGRVSVMVCDARRLDSRFSFDKILLDAPCSGSGTVSEEHCEFTAELYDRSRRLQAELLKKAISLLKPGKRAVYSTCSILRGENEEILKSVLPSAGGKIIPIPEGVFPEVPRLPTEMSGTLCVKPSRLFEGFFVAHIEKI